VRFHPVKNAGFNRNNTRAESIRLFPVETSTRKIRLSNSIESDLNDSQNFTPSRQNHKEARKIFSRNARLQLKKKRKFKPHFAF
jgi:hypothetical protein